MTIGKLAVGNQWLKSYFSTIPKDVKSEARYKHAAIFLLSKICTEVTEEIELPNGLRADVGGVLQNGRWIVLESKNFEQSTAMHVDAVMQASSYADAIKQPVFIGPFDGSKSLLCSGNLAEGMSVLHLLAGRLNVGFLAVNHAGNVQLILRGQVLCALDTGIHSKFDDHYHYVTRNGSKQVQA